MRENTLVLRLSTEHVRTFKQCNMTQIGLIRQKSAPGGKELIFLVLKIVKIMATNDTMFFTHLSSIHTTTRMLCTVFHIVLC